MLHPREVKKQKKNKFIGNFVFKKDVIVITRNKIKEKTRDQKREINQGSITFNPKSSIKRRFNNKESTKRERVRVLEEKALKAINKMNYQSSGEDDEKARQLNSLPNILDI